MSNTNLVLGSNWSMDEWPEYVAVSHEGTCEGMRVYVPERTCDGCAEKTDRCVSDECSWCNRNPMYSDFYAKVVE